MAPDDLDSSARSTFSADPLQVMTSLFSAWENFYVIVGSAGAALRGLSSAAIALGISGGAGIVYTALVVRRQNHATTSPRAELLAPGRP